MPGERYVMTGATEAADDAAALRRRTDTRGVRDA